MTERAREAIRQSEEKLEAQVQVNEKMYEKYEREAKRNWDLFYKVNKTNFYKDRHYIKYEFVELAERIAKTPSEV